MIILKNKYKYLINLKNTKYLKRLKKINIIFKTHKRREIENEYFIVATNTITFQGVVVI